MRERDSSHHGSATSAAVEQELTVVFGSAMWEMLKAEAQRQGVSPEELVGFATAYYLADSDSGRVARHMPPLPESQAGEAAARRLAFAARDGRR